MKRGQPYDHERKKKEGCDSAMSKFNAWRTSCSSMTWNLQNPKLFTDFCGCLFNAICPWDHLAIHFWSLQCDKKDPSFFGIPVSVCVVLRYEINYCVVILRNSNQENGVFTTTI
jgi:hypothetical protein